MKRESVKEKKNKKSVIKKILIISVCIILMLSAVLFAIFKLALDPYRGTIGSDVVSLSLDDTITISQAVEDIDYVMEMYRERHPAWLEEGNTRASDVENRYDAEIAALKESGVTEITVLEEWQIISRIMHCLYDGHSTVFLRRDDFRYIDDFTQIHEYGLPVLINGEDYDTVLHRFFDVYQYETESYAQAVFDSLVLVNENYLRWCGVDTADGITLTFDAGDGVLRECSYGFVPIDEVAGYGGNSSDEENKWVYYDIDRENGIGIFTLTSCEFNSEYKETVKEFFEAVNEAGIEHVILDLRWNGGGSSMVGDEFLKYCDIDGYYGWPVHVRYGPFLLKYDKMYIKNHRQQPQYHGDLYVLTNKRTFSSAMDFTMYIMDNDLGVVVGEPAGNLPDSYGDLLNFATPNSHLIFSISYKRWFRIDETKTGQPLDPDYPCPSQEAMDVAYELILG
ncbi:MAG: hypothetical protein K5871_11070 [Lachnospiraceae bacterium]|nr:hypothetical protein [Lachnospiraceae bacterium]